MKTKQEELIEQMERENIDTTELRAQAGNIMEEFRSQIR